MNENSALLQLRDKKNHSIITDPFHISTSAETETLSSYLRAVLSSTSEYAFYYQNIRIVSDIQKIIEMYALDYESTIIIDYIDIENQQYDINIICEDVPILLLNFKDHIFCQFYNKTVSIFDKNLNKVSNFIKKQELLSSIDGMSCSESHIFCYKKNIAYNLESGDIIAVTDNEIIGIAVCKETVAIATADRAIYIITKEDMAYNNEIGSFSYSKTNKDSERFTVNAREIPKDLKMSMRKIVWIESYNSISKCSRKNGNIKNYNIGFSLNKLNFDGESIIASTADGLLVRIENDEKTKIPINTRFSDEILIIKDNIVVTSQFKVLGIDKYTYDERFCLFFHEQVNSVTFNSEFIYIGNGKQISGYDISKVLINENS